MFFFSCRNVSFFRLYLFFISSRNHQNHAPNRQRTVSFFPVVIARTARPTDRRLYLFFSRLYLFFFPVVVKISRYYKKNANIPPETTVSFFSGHNVSFFSGGNYNFPRRLNLFFPVVIARTTHLSDRRLYLFFRS